MTMNPALTPDEWATETFSPSHWGLVAHSENELSVRCPDNREIFKEQDRHKLAGLALHNQPFGFTREMVRCLRDLGHYNQSREDSALAHEALLPSRGRIMEMTIPEQQVAQVVEKAKELMADPRCTVKLERGTKNAPRFGDVYNCAEWDGSYTLTISVPPEDA